MKKKLIIMTLFTMFMLATFAPIVSAMSAECEHFAATVVVGSSHSVRDAISCLVSDPMGFYDLIM